MAKAKKKPTYNDSVGVYRCPKDQCKHRWEASLNWNAECPKCGELQGPVVVK